VGSAHPAQVSKNKTGKTARQVLILFDIIILYTLTRMKIAIITTAMPTTVFVMSMSSTFSRPSFLSAKDLKDLDLPVILKNKNRVP